MTGKKQSGNEGKSQEQVKQSTVPKEVPTPKPLTEHMEKGAYKGPADPKPAQPEQMINPRPTNQQGSGEQQSDAGSTES